MSLTCLTDTVTDQCTKKFLGSDRTESIDPDGGSLYRKELSSVSLQDLPASRRFLQRVLCEIQSKNVDLFDLG